MKTFAKLELDKILDNHKLWLSSGGKSWIIDKLEPALSTTPADYHNPADVEALR